MWQLLDILRQLSWLTLIFSFLMVIVVLIFKVNSNTSDNDKTFLGFMLTAEILFSISALSLAFFITGTTYLIMILLFLLGVKRATDYSVRYAKARKETKQKATNK